MAKKSLSGKRWFESLGQREASQGKPHWLGQHRQDWPLWAKEAYADGWWQQSQKSTKSERRLADAYWMAQGE